MSYERPSHVRYYVLAAFLSLAFINYLDRICMAKAAEDIKRDLGFNKLSVENMKQVEVEVAALEQSRNGTPATAEERDSIEKTMRKDLETRRWGWVMAAFQLGYVIFEVPGGWMGDRWGVRSIIVRILIWWSAFTALTGSTDTVVRLFIADPSPLVLVGSLILVRFLFGAGEAGAFPNISRAMSRWFPSSARARVQGSIWLASRWGGGLSTIIYLQLLVAFSARGGDWRHVFWFLGLIGVVWAAWFAWWYRNRPEEMPGVNQAECDLIRGGPAQSAERGSIYDDDAHAPVPWLRLFTSTNLLALYMAAFCSSFCWYFHASQLVPYLRDTFNADDKQTTLALSAPLIGGGVFCILGGVFSQWLIARGFGLRLGRTVPGFIAFASAAACLLAVPYFNANRDITAAIILITLCFTLQDLHMASLWSLTSDIGGRYAGTLAGNMNMLGNIGGFVGIIVVPEIIRFNRDPETLVNWNNVFWMNGVVYIVGALMWLRINPNEKLLLPSEIVSDKAQEN